MTKPGDLLYYAAVTRRVSPENIQYVTARTKRLILIEPLNRHDAPGYFLSSTNQALDLIKTVNADNLKLMFDCYHVGRNEGDIITRLISLQPIIGHIQFASVPDRGTPDHGEVNYPWLFTEIEKLGWKTPLGAEYKPQGSTDESLDWMSS